MGKTSTNSFVASRIAFCFSLILSPPPESFDHFRTPCCDPSRTFSDILRPPCASLLERGTSERTCGATAAPAVSPRTPVSPKTSAGRCTCFCRKSQNCEPQYTETKLEIVGKGARLDTWKEYVRSISVSVDMGSPFWQARALSADKVADFTAAQHSMST